jgi:hypothetical protein
MKTKSGYETNGDYIKYKCGFTSRWKVENESGIDSFKDEYGADMHIITQIVGCEKAFPICNHWKIQESGCNNCKFGWNKNCSNSETHGDITIKNKV